MEKGKLENIVNTGRAAIAEGTVLTWTNVPRAFAELCVGMDAQSSANSMIGASAAKYIVGPTMQWARIKVNELYEKVKGNEYLENVTDWIEKKGLKFESKSGNSKKRIDQVLGFTIAAGEIAVDMAAYHFIYGEKEIGKTIIPSMVSTVLGGLPWIASFNGRLLDTALDARGLKHNGRSLFSEYVTKEEKERAMNTVNAMLLGFAGSYVVGTKLAAMLS